MSEPRSAAVVLTGPVGSRPMRGVSADTCPTCGGAFRDANGVITEAYSQFSAEEIERCAASRARMMAGEDDPNDLDDILAQEDRRVIFGYA